MALCCAWLADCARAVAPVNRLYLVGAQPLGAGQSELVRDRAAARAQGEAALDVACNVSAMRTSLAGSGCFVMGLRPPACAGPF
jgi:hypothetical protein